MAVKYIPEPFRIKVVENIQILSKQERIQKIADAHYNVFNLNSEDVYIDLLTDSGTNAMSAQQWSGMMAGDEAYAGAKSYQKIVAAGQDIFGYQFIQPVHQGRAAEKVLLPLLLGPQKYAIANMFFDTTRAHVEIAGARAIDCVVKEAKNISLRAPFKGNMDVKLLEQTINQLGPQKIGLVVMTITNNSAGGQPVSMQNIRETASICQKYHLPLCMDAARFSENAYFIKKREPEFANKSIKAIVREMFSYADMFTMSAKKDAIVNIGGLIGIKNNPELITLIKERTIAFEGFISYGGLAGRDLEAIASGLYEGLGEAYLQYRVGQSEYLGAKLDEVNIAYQTPPGGHGLFIDAKSMFPHIPYFQFPAQALAIELYIEAGIRTCDVGSFMLGNDPDTNEQLQAHFEFTRLAIPRRVYTQAHLDVIVEALINIKNRSSSVKGYEIIWEPKVLRHFQAHLKPIK
ncbi:MAG TPA: tryptophanase [Bacilli bacterium]|nr:MAG: Tryptophanase 1 [Tenericutes bacterium ADurb.BinA124]HPX84633.1 tryptophanase [Bacilli bacterium]HQC74294.1 tryptophanase [Bacilli bacterium]